MKKMRHALMGIAVAGYCIAAVPWSSAATADGPKRPVLYEFIQQTVGDHPALKASGAALAAARARARGQARPVYNPELEFGYENAEVNTKEIGVSQAFDWSGKRGARAGVGRAEFEAAEAAYDLAYKTLLTEILTALANYHTEYLKHSVAAEKEAVSVKFLALAKRLSSAGEMPRAELLTAQLALAESRAAKNEAAAALSSANERLVAIIGEDRDFWPKLDGVPSTLHIGTDDIDLIVENLPEIRLAIAETEISRARIKVAKTDRMPDPTIGLRVGEEGNSNLFGLSVSMPIPIRNSYKAEVQAAGSDLLGAQQAYYSVNRQVRARFNASLKRYRSASEAWRVWEENGAEPLDEQRALLGQLLEAREISAINYLVQLNQTFTTETASIELNGRLWSAWFEWQNAGANVGTWLETLQ